MKTPLAWSWTLCFVSVSALLVTPSSRQWTPSLSQSSSSSLPRISISQVLRLSRLDDIDNIDDIDSIDDVDSFEQEFTEDSSHFENSANTRISSEQQQKFTRLINTTLSTHGLGLKKIEWFTDRIEVTTFKLISSTVDDNSTAQEDFPNADMLEGAHKSIYSLLESSDASLVEDYELIVASPGIEDVLKTPRDFITFQGFPVIVSLKQEFRKKLIFEGSLQEKTDEHVIISIKGRILKIPLELVDRVELPKPKFEPNDPEIRKLR